MNNRKQPLEEIFEKIPLSDRTKSLYGILKGHNMPDKKGLRKYFHEARLNKYYNISY